MNATLYVPTPYTSILRKNMI